MVLSGNGDHPMTYLSDTARVVLAAAAQRDDLSVLPFPDGVKAKGGAEQKVLAGLRKRGFIRVIETPGRPQRIVITSEGMAAIGVEPDEGETGPAEADGRHGGRSCSGERHPDARCRRRRRGPRVGQA